MRRYIHSALVAVLVAMVLSWAPASEAGARGVGPRLGAARIPFIENAGQWRKEAKFCAPIFTGAFFVTLDGQMVYLLEGAGGNGCLETVIVRESVIGAEDLSISGSGRLASTTSYFTGKRPSRWARGAAMYESITLGEVYPSIEFELRASGTNVEKRFTVSPGGDPRDIRIRVEADGNLGVGKTGELVLATEGGEITFTRPVAYQEMQGGRRYIEVAYEIDGDEYGFEVADFDPGHDLVIDPLLAGTYFGGMEGDGLLEIPAVMDADGNIYIADRTKSWDLPTTPTAYDTSFSTARSDIFISKFDGDLTTLLASTFLGGTGFEGAWPGANLVLDKDGSVWVTAMTKASDFPVTPGAYDTLYNGTGDFFIAHLSADLEHLLAATFLGGTNIEERPHLAISDDGFVYLVGNTRSSNYPAIYGCIDTTYGGGNADVVVTKLDTALTTVYASTYLGGGGFDAPEDILLDEEGYPYITGWTMSTVWPVSPGAYCDTYMGGSYDAFITRLNPSLTDVSASTFLGGSNWDFIFDMVLDGDVIYVTGHTASDEDFPVTAGAYDTSYGGNGIEGVDDDAFVSKLSADLTALHASSYLGGRGWENGYALALDGEGNVYVSGTTCSGDYPTEPSAYDGTYGGSANMSAGDVFVTRLDTLLTAVTASTYLGGAGVDQVGSIIWDGDGLYVSMGTNSEGLETGPAAYDTSFNGGESIGSDRNWGGDVYIAKLDPLLCEATGGVGREYESTRDVPLWSHPNPFAAETALRFSLPEPSAVRLVVYDVTGHAIRALADREVAAGDHSVTWDGRDESGVRVAPGIYFSVLEIRGEVVSRKLVSVR